MTEKVHGMTRDTKHLFHLAAGLLLVAAGGFMLLRHFFGIREPYWLVPMPLLFFAMGYGMGKVLRLVPAERYLVNVYLVLKVMKILCLVLVALAYAFVFRVDMILFFPMFFSFYLLYLVWETRFLFRYEKSLKTEML